MFEAACYSNNRAIELQDRAPESATRLSKEIYLLWNMKSNISFRRFNIPAAAALRSPFFFSVLSLSVSPLASFARCLLMSWRKKKTFRDPFFSSLTSMPSLRVLRATSKLTNSAEYHKMAPLRVYSNFVADRQTWLWYWDSRRLGVVVCWAALQHIFCRFSFNFGFLRAASCLVQAISCPKLSLSVSLETYNDDLRRTSADQSK